MTVCQYFLRGTCRFGDTCRNEHPANARGFGNQSWTNTNPSSSKTLLLFTEDSIKCDLTSEKPIWPLSTYAPAKNEPNLISGLDESMEELRVRAVLALKAGNVNEYTTYETNKIQAANQVYNNARNSLLQVYQSAVNQSQQGKPTSTSNPSVFASASSSSTNPAPSSAFGKPSGFNQQQSTFGQSNFGGPSSTTPSAFGQPAQTPQSTFSSLQPKPPTTTTPATAFGQPSSFGQPQQPQSVFGQPSSLIKPASGAFSAFANQGGSSSSPFAAAVAANQQSGATGSGGVGGGGFSAFAGQPRTFGSGASGNTNTGSGFGGGGTFGTPAQSAFGQNQNQPTSVFGQPSQPGGQQQPGGGFNAFGSTTSNQSSFSQTQPQSAFGNTPQNQPQSAFGTPSQQPSQSVFGGGGGGGSPFNPLNAGSTSSAFTPLSNISNPLNTGLSQPQPPTNPFGAAPPPPPPSSQFQNPNPNVFRNPFTNTTNPPNTINTSMNPLANPDTKPNFAAAIARMKYKPGKTPYDLLLPSGYVGLLPEGVVEAFKSERFEFGKVPDWVPPVEFR